MVLSLLLSLFLGLAQAQEGKFQSACFLGLNDADSAATLNPCEGQDLLNTEANLGGTAILKRKGFSKIADLTYATSPVSGSHSFIDSSGNRLDVVCHDRNCAKSTNGNAFANFLTTAGAVGSLPRRWSFVDAGGNLFGGNDRYDKILKYDGTTRTSPVGMPLGSILELTQDRLVIADISGNPNRVHYSSAGAYDQFTVGVNPEDSFFDDIGAPGDKIRGLKHLNGVLYIFKTASITGCELGDQYSTKCAVISPNLGTTDPGSITVAGSCLYFRAQDKNYWELCRDGLRQISAKIPNLVKSQSGGLGGGENSNTQTTQADWQAGSQNPLASWDTATIPGSIFPSSNSFLHTSSADFNAGTFTNMTTRYSTGGITLDINLGTLDNFSDGNCTGWTPCGSSNWVIGTCSLGFCFTRNIASTAQTYLSYSGSIYGVHEATVVASGFMQTFIGASTNDAATTNGYSVKIACSGGAQTVTLSRHDAGAEAALASQTLSGGCGQRYYSADVTASSITVYVGGTAQVSASDTAYRFKPSYYILKANDANITNIKASSFRSGGSYVSPTMDFGMLTPTYGPFTIAYSLSTGGSFPLSSFGSDVRLETSNDGSSWVDLCLLTDGGNRPLCNANGPRRYGRWSIAFSNSDGGTSPYVDEVQLAGVSTGTFRTACIQPNPSITTWGVLSCAESLAGQGSIVYYATSAASCATLPSTPPNTWQTSVTNNATLPIAVGSATYIGWRSLLGSATDQALIESCTLAWNEGTPAQPSWAVYDSIKNAVYWTTTISGASSSNRLLKYDRTLDSWFPFDIPAQAPRLINNSLYFGGASSGTWNQFGLVDADLGNAINAYWKSKDVGSDSPFAQKDFKTFSLLAKNAGTGNLGVTYTFSNAQTGSYTVSLATGTGISYARFNDWLTKGSAQNFMNVRIGNNSTVPFEVLGIGVGWIVKPWIVGGP